MEQQPMFIEPRATESDQAPSPPFIIPKTPKKLRPLGEMSPIVWVVEPAFGCNLTCLHCVAEKIAEKDNVRMDERTWRNTFAIINEVSPFVRVDIGGVVGEPTLNKNLVRYMEIARALAPNVQIQITTNGTRLLAREFKMKDLLDAGANVLYVDQYGKHSRFEQLARESGYPWYQYYAKPDGAPTPWRYWGPDLKVICLMDEPATWPESRRKANLLGSWYGEIDFERAKSFNIIPLTQPLTRRCNQPFQFVTVSATGDYLLCCQDGLQVTRGMFGNVNEGIPGFRKFWFGREMQTVRGRLRNKDRASTEYACKKCSITFARCDYKLWSDENVSKWWDGEAWQPI